MAKSSFINKKALLILFIIAVLVAGGIGIYFLVKPKVDLDAPFNNFYELMTNDDYKQVQSYNEKIYNYLLTCEDRTTNQTEKDEIGKFKVTYSQIQNAFLVYNNIKDILLDNLIFTKDNDGNMLKIQQNMTNSYKEVLSNVKNCKIYLDNYLIDSKVDINNKSNKIVMDLITNYNNIHYFKYLNSLSNFYNIASQIYQNYLTMTYKVNRLSGYVVNTTCVWQQKLMQKITDVNSNAEQINVSQTKLTNFQNTQMEKSKNYYNNQTNYDNLLDIFYNIKFDKCIDNLANNTYSNFVESQQTENLKNKAKVLGEDFFLVI